MVFKFLTMRYSSRAESITWISHHSKIIYRWVDCTVQTATSAHDLFQSHSFSDVKLHQMSDAFVGSFKVSEKLLWHELGLLHLPEWEVREQVQSWRCNPEQALCKVVATCMATITWTQLRKACDNLRYNLIYLQIKVLSLRFWSYGCLPLTEQAFHQQKVFSVGTTGSNDDCNTATSVQWSSSNWMLERRNCVSEEGGLDLVAVMHAGSYSPLFCMPNPLTILRPGEFLGDHRPSSDLCREQMKLSYLL